MPYPNAPSFPDVDQMSSEDDYYHDRYDYRYDRRSSRKTRRKTSSPKRRRHFDSNCFCTKNRRTKGLCNQFTSAPRLVGFIILFVILVYEVLVLSGATSSKTTPRNQSDTKPIPKSRQLWTPPAPPPAAAAVVSSESHQEAPSALSTRNSSDSNSVGQDFQASSPDVDEPSAATSPGRKPPTQVSTDQEPGSDSANAKTSTSAMIPSRRESNTEQIHLPEKAIRMEAKGADEDPDIEPGNVRKPGSSQTDSDSSTSSSISDQSSSTSKTTHTEEKGAEPGAGENFWNWFQETKGTDQSNVSKTLPCPKEYERLCQMYYKYIRKYKIRRIFDVSCEKNFEWIGGVLKKAGNELWGFKYYCSLWDGQRAQDARKRLQGLPFVQFDDAQWWRTGFASDTELLFAWDTLAHLPYGRVWNFFVKARKQDVKYILVDNYPGILNDPSPKRDYLNLRKHPFRFPPAKEVAQNVTEPGETAKRQLLFYETSMLPDNVQ